MKVKGLLFDKDGTLFDYQTTWNSWTRDVIRDLSKGDPSLAQAIADAVDFDLQKGEVRTTSPLIAGTNREASELFSAALDNADVDEVEAYITTKALSADLSEVLPLRAYFDDLKAQGVAVGVMTNDSEQGAKAHLASVDAYDILDFVAGFDSGYGAKPEPGPLLAFAKAMNLDPAECAMVGDSTHDLIAGQRAGMKTIGVLTGLAPRAELAPYASVVLQDISEIPAWLA